MPFNERLRGFPDLVGLTATRQATQAELDRLQTQEQALRDDTHFQRLQEEVKHRAAERDALAVARERTARDQADRELNRQAEQASLANLERDAQAVAERRRDLQHAAGFDAALASERLDELQTQEPFAEESPAAWRALGAGGRAPGR
jgi:hypothetical protein